MGNLAQKTHARGPTPLSHQGRTRLAADCLQPTLRSGFRQQLKASVRRLRRGGSREEMLCGPSAWAYDHVHP